MTRLFSILLLLLYIGVLLLPNLPYIDYVLNKDYIINELCVNKNKPEVHCEGMCHLRKQIKKSTPLNTPYNSPDKKEIKKNQIVNQFEINTYINIHLTSNQTFQILNEKLPSSLFIDVPFPPPKHVS